MSTVKANTYQDASGGNTATINSMTPTADSLQGFRNRIINGDMRIDQRNAGASVTLTSGGAVSFAVDRFYGYYDTSATSVTNQQVTDVPTGAGFVNSYKWTTGTGVSATASQQARLVQRIEGLNVADLMWGTANAKTVTISFWVKSSLSGTFSCGFQNSAFNRSYVATYTISSVNTWEYKTITVAGDTSGTWLTTNGIGISISFDLGTGSNRQTTANTWASGNFFSQSSQPTVIGNSGATFFLTGVQLEVGSVATPFERRDYGRELMMCQRYLPAFNSTGTASAIPGSGIGAATTYTTYNIPFMVPTRVAPTGVSISSGAHFTLDDAVSLFACDALTFNISSVYGGQVLPTRSAAGLTQYRPYNLRFNNASGQLLFTGCEL